MPFSAKNVKGAYMNLLPILILFLLFGGNRLSEIKNLLSKIDFQSFAPILKLIGADDKTIEFISSESFAKFLSGEVSPIELLKNFPMQGMNIGKKNSPENTSDEENISFKLDPIKEVASSDIEEDLGSFFS